MPKGNLKLRLRAMISRHQERELHSITRICPYSKNNSLHPIPVSRKGHGLILRSLVDSVAFCPPLIITEAQIDDMFDRFAKALDETEAWVEKNGLRNVA